MFAELFGKRTGYCKGKGGSKHIVGFFLGVLGANGVVGGGFPIIIGAGLSIKLRQTDQPAVVFFGDGSANRGTFHEAGNMAAIWSLPVVFICESNLYASTARFLRSIQEMIEEPALILGWWKSIRGQDTLPLTIGVEAFLEREFQP